MTIDDADEFAVWEQALTDERPDNRAQVERDLTSGRLRMLDPAAVEATCEVVSAVRTAPSHRCHRQAVVFDTTDNLHQCPGHGLGAPSRRTPITPVADLPRLT